MSEFHSHPAVEALQGSIPRPGVNLAYRLGLILIAVAMLTLPLIYVGLIVAVAYALYLYVGVGPSWFGLYGGSGGAMMWRVLGFAAPIVAGVILILFMIKPLFAARAAAMEPLTLDRTRERGVHDFVERLCRVVGAPSPRRIDVDCDVNASAAFARGGWGLVSGGLVLTMGLPLVAGLSLRNLTGVLAHEFGHFAQGTGMRFSYVIRTVNGWFARVVYERDAWDEKLEEYAHRADFRISFMLQLARFFVWLTRRILWALMMIGHGISCFMLRQMEFDADRYEARLAGARAFEQTMLRLHLLNIAAGQTFGILARSWDEGHLPEKLPDLIVQLADRVPAELEAKVVESLSSGKTGWFDTHPAEAERIARARRESADGIFRLEAPATALFHDFDDLSRDATLKYYRDTLGDSLQQARLVPVGEVLEADTVLHGQLASLERVFQDRLSILRPLWLPRELAPASDWQATRDAMLANRRAMGERASAAASALEAYAKEDERRMKAAGARALLEAEVRIDPGKFELNKADLGAANEATAKAEQSQIRLAPDLNPYLESAGAWLSAALQLLSHPQTAERPGKTSQFTDTKPLLLALSAMREAHGDFLFLRETFITAACFIEHFGDYIEGDPAVLKLKALAEQLMLGLRLLRENLAAPYPFEHGGGPIPIGVQVVGTEIASASDIGELYAQAAAAQERYYQLYFRLMGSLALTAESIEGDVAAQPGLDFAP